MLILIETLDKNLSFLSMFIRKMSLLCYLLFFLFSLTIQERLMENLGYTGPHEFRKHTLTARWACVWSSRVWGEPPELDYLISTHLWTGPHVLLLACSVVLAVWSRICEITLCAFTHSHSSGEAKGISAITEWLSQSGREGFKAMLHGLEKVCLNGLSATERDMSIRR